MDRAEAELFRRTVGAAMATHSGAALDGALAALGWPEALGADPAAAVAALFEEQGRAAGTSSALGDVLAHGLGAGSGAGASLVLPALGAAEPPGRADGGRVVVDGLGLTGLAARETALVAARGPQGDMAVVVVTAELHVDGTEGLDPALGLCRVGGVAAPVEVTPLGRHRCDGAVARARTALGHE
ncbi:MAG: hypothetical protein ACRDY1_04880, partial [Acidimicrobiales bacterium]